MRLFPIALGCLIVLALGMDIQSGGFMQDKEAKKEGPKKEIKLEKKSVLASSERGKKATDSLGNFPYTLDAKGKELAESMAKMLNSAEELYHQGEKDKVPGSRVIILHTLNVMDLQLSLTQMQLLLKNRLPEPGYKVVWVDGQWAVKELPKKEKK